MTPQDFHEILGLIQDDATKMPDLNAWKAKVYNSKPDLIKLM